MATSTTSTGASAPIGIQITKDVAEGNVVDYYKSKLETAMATSDSDAKIQALSSLREEIDKTITNLIEQKKNVKYSDIKDVAGQILVTPTAVNVGASSTPIEGVSIETQIDKSNVTVTSSGSELKISDSGVDVKASNVAIDSSGLSVEGAHVAISPKAALEENKNLNAHSITVNNMALEKDGNTSVYNVEYAVSKNVLGFIPATANQEIKIDASSGQTVSERGPWWNFIATDATPPQVLENAAATNK
jgi:hypothetical protein